MNGALAGVPALVASGDGGIDPGSIGPGLLGFLATFGIVIAAILLFRSMTGHLRKVDHRARRQVGDEDERASESSLEDPGDDDEREQRS